LTLSERITPLKVVDVHTVVPGPIAANDPALQHALQQLARDVSNNGPVLKQKSNIIEKLN
jgi:hypothetical protein